VRRIRVFFYNGYAEAVANAVLRLRERRRPDRKRDVPFLMSLSNVPAKCIFPHAIAPDGRHPCLQLQLSNPFGDEEFGMSSPYCICVGNKSNITYDPASDSSVAMVWKFVSLERPRNIRRPTCTRRMLLSRMQ
jgi:hypothetical protein